MKFKNLLLTTVLAILTSTSYADSYDNMGPSADAVTGTSGTDAIRDSGMSNGSIQESDATQNQNTGIVPPSSPNIPISRDGETMGDEDY